MLEQLEWMSRLPRKPRTRVTLCGQPAVMAIRLGCDLAVFGTRTASTPSRGVASAMGRLNSRAAPQLEVGVHRPAQREHRGNGRQSNSRSLLRPLVATLARGLRIDITADNIAAAPAEVPAVDLRGIQPGRRLRLRLANHARQLSRRPNPAHHQRRSLGCGATRGAMRLHIITRSGARRPARLQGLTRADRQEIVPVIAVRLDAAGNRQVLDRFP